jgi:hypothetical protein
MYRAWCARCGGVALVVVTVQLYSTILGMDGVPLGDVEVGERMLEITQTHIHMKDTYITGTSKH